MVLGLSTTGALAKAHNPGGTEDPGSNVGKETVTASRTLGAAKGNGKVAQGNLGNSGSAGKPADDE